MSDYYRQPITQHLRDTNGLERSPYAVEVMPWTPRGHIEAALLFRGTIVSAFGAIETGMGKIAIRASRMPEYADFRPQYPYGLGKRFTFLRRIFAEGPLAPYGERATEFLSRVEAAAELRNMAAHAHMHVLPNQITFIWFPESREAEVTYERKPFTIPQLEWEAYRAARLSRYGQNLSDHLDQTGILPPVEWR